MVAQPFLFVVFALLGLWLTVADWELLALLSFGLGALSLFQSLQPRPVTAVPEGPAPVMPTAPRRKNGATRKCFPIVCECGHEGAIRLSGADQPYSSPAETYVLEGFSGDHVTVTCADDAPDDLIAYLEPKCPACGQTGKVKHGHAPARPRGAATPRRGGQAANGRIGAG